MPVRESPVKEIPAICKQSRAAALEGQKAVCPIKTVVAIFWGEYDRRMDDSIQKIRES